MIVTNIDRNNVDIYLENSGQNEAVEALKKFASIISEIKRLKILKNFILLLKKNFIEIIIMWLKNLQELVNK